jgi:hypothetical protein
MPKSHMPKVWFLSQFFQKGRECISMTNETVFQTDPNNLRSLVFGRDSTATARALSTDTSGNLNNLVLDGTLTSLLGATISAGTLTSAGTVSNILDGTISNLLGATITAGTLTSAGTVSNILGGTISNVLGATITAGTLTSAGTVSNILDGTISNLLGATITAGTLTSAGTVSNILGGTISNVLGATITAGTLTSAGTVSNILGGTISNVLGATITAGTLTSAGTVSNILDGTISNLLGATITAGTLSSVTSISQRNFMEQETLGITTADALTSLPAVTTSVLGTYSFFVYNSGTNPVNTQVEVSADGTHYLVDTTGSNPLASGSVDVLVPSRFLKYTRLSYNSATPGSATSINVIVNAQGT